MHNRNHSFQATISPIASNCAIACKIPVKWTAAVVVAVLLTVLSGFVAARCDAAELTQTIARIKSSVVGVGTFIKTRSPSFQLGGTGFVVADGLHVITNAHNYAKPLDSEKLEVPMVLIYNAGDPQPREAQLLATDKAHDLALLKISGAPLPVMPIGDSDSVREGQMLAFTGFPIGLVLGMHPATHRGMVSAIVPVALPGITARTLDERTISRIRDSTYRVFQLDGTAYPGNSGSPLYDPGDGTVYGIINATFVQGTRENAIGRPSGISYAIPSRFIRELLQREKVPGF
jgi:S1-C subfamily serine protease